MEVGFSDQKGAALPRKQQQKNPMAQNSQIKALKLLVTCDYLFWYCSLG